MSSEDQREEETPSEDFPGEGSAGLAATANLPMPTIGRIVHYRLSEQDLEAINRRRTSSASIANRLETGEWPEGAQAHVGNSVHAGGVVPMIIVKVLGITMVNGQAFLDGSDQLWVSSAKYGAGDGSWIWPPRA